VNVRATIVAALMVLLAGACGSSGRTLPPAGPGQTASIITTTATPTTAPAAANRGSDDSGMTIVAPWQDNTAIDPSYTCKGADVSPTLSWRGVPSDAVELAVAMTDLDADGFVHWVIARLDPASTGIARGKVPAGAVQAINGFGKPGYGGPCPPSGTHTYLLTLYALTAPSGITATMDGKAAVGKLEGAQAASVSITGVFGS
jgi:Raf kinase inhibitor-like YbhB/YbcL family protein